MDRIRRVAGSGYDIEELLGQGGAGVVYRARCRRTGRLVALKQLSEPADPQGLRRFERERRALAESDHPALVPVLDWGVGDDGRPFLAMPYLEGMRSLADWIDDLWRRGPPDGLREPVLEVMRDLCGALDHLHGRGIIHRDIKPSNLLIGRDGHVVLIDLGLAHLAGSQLTQAGARVGTPAYSAPELVRGEAVSPATDVYMAGLLLQELITGRRASADLGAYLTAMADGRRAFPPPSDVNPRIGPPLDALVRRATEAVAGERFGSAGELWRALEAVPAEEWDRERSGAGEGANRTERFLPPETPHIMTGAAGDGAGPRVRGTAPLAAGLVALALIGAGVFVMRGRPAREGPAITVDAGFRALAIRVRTGSPCTGRLLVQGAPEPARELSDRAPARDHRFLVDGLTPGQVYRFSFRGNGNGESTQISAMGPEPPRMMSLVTLATGGRATLRLETTQPIEGEIALADTEGASATVPLGGYAARHEIRLPAGTWSASATARVRARSLLGEQEDLPAMTVRLR